MPGNSESDIKDVGSGKRTPRPKMKSSKEPVSYPRLVAPLPPVPPETHAPGPSEAHYTLLPAQPEIIQPEPSTKNPPKPAPEPAAESGEQEYDDPEICIFCDDGGLSILR
ncbi:hypothetical protein R1flu_013781 [Riccia fluitans]|uniref:Uncharacterized protein n=1 Tax=Riccia fluitans TaxID=41844 RepID=A0ABD1YEY8_9MARC